MAKTFDVFGSSVRQLEVAIGGDILLHFMVSMLLGIGAYWASPIKYRAVPLPLFNYLILFVLVLVSIDELLQLFSERRQFSVLDLAANICGITSGAVIFSIVSQCVNYIRLWK